MAAFLSGMTTAMFLVAGVFFLKFWRASRNRFFASFAASCWLFALERITSLSVFLLMDPETYQNIEARGWVYTLRLVGFIIIFVAIIDRNRTKMAQRKAARLPGQKLIVR